MQVRVQRHLCFNFYVLVSQLPETEKNFSVKFFSTLFSVAPSATTTEAFCHNLANFYPYSNFEVARAWTEESSVLFIIYIVLLVVLSICLFVYPFFVCPFVGLFVPLCLSNCLPVCLFICPILFVHLSVHLSVCLPLYCLSTCLPFYLFVYPLCLST